MELLINANANLDTHGLIVRATATLAILQSQVQLATLQQITGASPMQLGLIVGVAIASVAAVAAITVAIIVWKAKSAITKVET